MKNRYITELVSLLERLDLNNIEAAADIVTQTLENGGVIHAFGAGHSASVAFEGFHRSGAFAAYNMVLDPALQFQHGAAAGTAAERKEGYVKKVLDGHTFTPGDCIFISSNSGKNPAIVEAALYARERGVKVIAVTAYAAQKDAVSRHSSGKKLCDAADVVLDNLASAFEANITLFDDKKFGPVATVTGAALINAVLFRAAEKLLAKGIKPEIYISSNNGGDEHNAALEKKYSKKVKHL